MGKYKVVEHFISVNGEGRRAGQLAYFIRFAGCNLSCSYCDTKWANKENVAYSEYDENALYAMVKESGVKNVTLTGGEPLLQEDFNDLLQVFGRDNSLNIEIETNGSIDIRPFMSDDTDSVEENRHNTSFTLDYKLGTSGMENRMFLQNFEYAGEKDTVKFVVGNREDLSNSLDIIKEYRLVEKGCGIYLSPCYGKIDPVEIVEYMKEKKLNSVNIQLQLHKYIWSPDRKGV